MKRLPPVGQEPALPLCYLLNTQHVPQNGNAVFELYRSSLADEARGWSGAGRRGRGRCGSLTHFILAYRQCMTANLVVIKNLFLPLKAQ